MLTIKIHNVDTGEITEREMTSKEQKEFEKFQEENVLRIQAENEVKTQKEALLQRLGITEEEVKLLLG